MGFPNGSVLRHLQIYHNDHTFVPCTLPSPTDAQPGTVEKIAVLRARLAAGQHLHHPQDARPPASVELCQYSLTAPPLAEDNRP